MRKTGTIFPALYIQLPKKSSIRVQLTIVSALFAKQPSIPNISVSLHPVTPSLPSAVLKITPSSPTPWPKSLSPHMRNMVTLSSPRQEQNWVTLKKHWVNIIRHWCWKLEACLKNKRLVGLLALAQAGNASVSDDVTALKVITADQEVIEITEEKDPLEMNAVAFVLSPVY